MNVDEFSKQKMENCLKEIHEAYKLGFQLLQEDLKNAKPYNHDKPAGDYGKKNEYVNKANLIGYKFLRGNLTGISKDYYWQIYNRIVNFEKSNTLTLNKGIVCANWGVSDLAEGDIDGGIAHLLWAGYEDRGWLNTTYAHDIFNNPLYTQFAEGTARGGKSQFGGKAPYILFEEAIEDFYHNFGKKWKREDIFNSIADNDEHRSILDGSLWGFARNIVIYTEENPTIFKKNDHNIYSKLRLFNALIDLCRFIELRMRHHEKPPKSVKTLGNLLFHVFEKESWFQKEVRKNYRQSETATEFNNLIKTILKMKPPSKYILLLWVTRNYSVHVCDADIPDFFENVEEILKSILGGYLFYLLFKKIL